MKNHQRDQAIEMRKEGKTYREIRAVVPVAKSTLSVWLRGVGLAEPQRQRLTARKRAAQRRGALARHKERLRKTKVIHVEEEERVGALTEREEWLIGTALYWAEGAKERPWSTRSPRVDFSNMDADMVVFFCRWLLRHAGVERERLIVSVYLHKTHAARAGKVIAWWNKKLVPFDIRVKHLYFKRHAKAKTVRKRTADDVYFGTLRITVRASCHLQRRIQGWIYGINSSHCRVV